MAEAVPVADQLVRCRCTAETLKRKKHLYFTSPSFLDHWNTAPPQLSPPCTRPMQNCPFACPGYAIEASAATGGLNYAMNRSMRKIHAWDPRLPHGDQRRIQLGAAAEDEEAAGSEGVTGAGAQGGGGGGAGGLVRVQDRHPCRSTAGVGEGE